MDTSYNGIRAKSFLGRSDNMCKRPEPEVFESFKVFKAEFKALHLDSSKESKGK